MIRFLYVLLILIFFLKFNFTAHAQDDNFDENQIDEIEKEDLRQNFDAEELKFRDSDQGSKKRSNAPPPSSKQNISLSAEENHLENVYISPDVKRVIGVEFFQRQTSSILTIKLNETADFKTYFEESGLIVVVDVKNTIIPPKWSRFLDTSEFRSAVSLVRPYPVAGRTNSVKFVIKLRDRVAVNTKREGNNIIVEIEIPEKYYGPHPKETVKPKEADDQQEFVKEDEETVEGISDQKIKDDEELEDQLREEGELIGDALDVDKIGPEELSEIDEKDYSADEFLSMGIKEIEGFTVNELSDDHKYTGKRVTVTFRDADIANIMDFISEISQMNMVLGDNVSGKVSIRLKDVPWDQALALILQSKMLGAVRHGNVIRIESLDKLRKEQEDAIQAIESAKRIEPLRTFMVPVNYARAADMKTQLADFLTKDRGKITVDERTNTLIIQDLTTNIERIRNLIIKLDTQTPQVLIEARIVEVSQSFSRGLNLDWRAMGGKISNTPLTLLSNVSASRDFQGETFGTFQLGFLNLSRIGDLTLALKIGESRSEVRLLSSPRIITQDNKPATISQKEEMEVTGKTVTTGAEGLPTITEEKKILSADLNLTVTPNITSDGGVLMNINIRNEFFKGSDGTKASRSAQTNVMVENGDTTVIGGIYSNQQTKARSGIPLLSWVPLIGWMFSSNETLVLRNELMIFITPTITNVEKAFISAGISSERDKESFDEGEDDSMKKEDDDFESTSDEEIDSNISQKEDANEYEGEENLSKEFNESDDMAKDGDDDISQVENEDDIWNEEYDDKDQTEKQNQYEDEDEYEDEWGDESL